MGMTTNNIFISIVRNSMPTLIAQQIIGVQPMIGIGKSIFSTDLRIPYHSHPRYKFSRKWHIGEVNPSQNGDNVYKWCKENFGSPPKNPDAWCRWYRYSSRKFYFRDEQDMLLFTLRWL